MEREPDSPDEPVLSNAENAPAARRGVLAGLAVTAVVGPIIAYGVSGLAEADGKPVPRVTITKTVEVQCVQPSQPEIDAMEERITQRPLIYVTDEEMSQNTPHSYQANKLGLTIYDNRSLIPLSDDLEVAYGDKGPAEGEMPLDEYIQSVHDYLAQYGLQLHTHDTDRYMPINYSDLSPEGVRALKNEFLNLALALGALPQELYSAIGLTDVYIATEIHGKDEEDLGTVGDHSIYLDFTPEDNHSTSYDLPLHELAHGIDKATCFGSGADKQFASLNPFPVYGRQSERTPNPVVNQRMTYENRKVSSWGEQQRRIADSPTSNAVERENAEKHLDQYLGTIITRTQYGMKNVVEDKAVTLSPLLEGAPYAMSPFHSPVLREKLALLLARLNTVNPAVVDYLLTNATANYERSE